MRSVITGVELELMEKFNIWRKITVGRQKRKKNGVFLNNKTVEMNMANIAIKFVSLKGGERR